MSDAPIHDLPAASSVAGTDVVPIDQGLVTRKATMQQVSQAVGPINVGVGIHNANAKTTPIDPDELGLVDTADGNTLKKLTWGNLKATLLTYFSALTGTWNISITGNAATSSLAAEATKLQTARNLDVTSFDGTADVTIVAPAIHAATNKATPVDADEAGIWDSVSGLLNKVTWANIKATLKTYFDGIYVALTNLAASSGSALVGFLQAGSGAVARTAQSKLRDFVSVTDFGATGDGVTDDTIPIENAIAASSNVYFPPGSYLISQKIVLAVGTKLLGASRYHSKIVLSGAIDGIEMAIQSSIEDLRIVGNATMTSSNSCLLVGTGTSCYRSKVTRCIIGGLNTSLGDSSTVKCGGNAASGGANTFLVNFDDTYFFFSSYGFKNINSGSQVNNAINFVSCEFQSNTIGAAIVTLNAVKFSQCTFENNDEEGLIVGNSKGASVDTCYFENNNVSAGSSIKSDCYIGTNATLTGAGTALGTTIAITNCFFTAGTNSLFGIYIDNQRNIEISNVFFSGYTTNPCINVTDNVNNTGIIDNIYANSAAPVVIGVSAGYMRRGNLSWTGVNFIPLQSSFNGITAAVASGGTVDIYGMLAGEVVLFTVSDAANGGGLFMSGIAESTVAGTITITPFQATGCSAANFFGSIRITNSTPGSLSLAWSVVKIKA